MENLVALAALAVLMAGLGVLALVRWRRGRKRPLITNEDYGCGCVVVSLLAAIVSFAVALWWFDEPLWLAAIIGLGLGIVVALQIGRTCRRPTTTGSSGQFADAAVCSVRFGIAATGTPPLSSA